MTHLFFCRTESSSAFFVMYKFENERYDITELVVAKALKILLIICRIKGVKCDKVDFSFKRFERLFIQGWKDLMFNDFPYNYRSKLKDSTDISAAKLSKLFKN